MSLVKNITLFVFVISIAVSCNNSIVTDNKIIGEKESIVIKKYGNPKKDTIYEITKDTELREYQSNLSGLLLKSKQSDTMLIKEMYWCDNPAYKLIVWFKKDGDNWVVVDNIKYKNNISF